MSTTEALIEPSLETATRNVDAKLEIVVVPVSDVARARDFYENLGWRLDADFDDGDGFRVIQFTPPGSPASIIFGSNVSAAAPGSAQGLYLIVSDIEAAHAELVRRGVEVSEIFHGASGRYYGSHQPFLFGSHRENGLDPDRGSYRSFASFNDPDGNGWVFQEITARLPGRIDSNETKFASVFDLAGAMRRAEAAHGPYEKTLGKRDEAWADWYAAYMVAEQNGEKLPG
jgi:catechol 2,3-dioxygenase-like lactoylglutathione lyase family enzyme